MKVTVLFIGTGKFAIPILEGLVRSDVVEIVGIVTQPDKPVGRKQELTPGPVGKWVATSGNLIKLETPVYKPQKLREESEKILSETNPELIVVASYGQMVPDNMLNEPKYGGLNVHGSLLPKLRGAVPVQMAILQGLEKTGITIQKMVKELDAGPIVDSVEVKVHNTDTTKELMENMAIKGRDLLIDVIPKWIDGSIESVEQDDSKASYTYKSDISKEKVEILYDTPVETAERMVRAFSPWPIAWFTLNGKRVKVFRAEIGGKEAVINGNNLSELGLIRLEKKLFLQLEDGVLELLELQLEGKKRREAKEYLYLVE